MYAFNFIVHILIFLGLQAAVHSLLQAVQEIAARGEGRDRDIHILVQRRLVFRVHLTDNYNYCLYGPRLRQNVI